MKQSMHPGSEQPAEKLCLDQFLKINGAVGTGGQAKLLIQSGAVIVNGQVETRRRRQLAVGDVVVAEGQTLRVKNLAGEVVSG